MKYDIEITSTIGYSNASPSFVGYKLAQFPKGQEVSVRVCSYGGSFFAGLELNRLFREHGNVTVYVTSYAASAATIAAMGAKKIIMDKYSCFLIHSVSQFILSWGQMNAKEIRKEIARLQASAEDNEKLDKMLVEMYSSKTGKSKEDIKKVLDKGAWLNPEECTKHKLVDEVVELGSSTVPSVQDDIKNAGLPDLPSYVRLPELYNNSSEGSDSILDSIPPVPTPDDSNGSQPDSSTLQKAVELFNTLRNIFTPNNNSSTNNIAMHKNWTNINALLNVEGLEIKDNKVTLTKEQLEKLNTSLNTLANEAKKATSRAQEIVTLENKVKGLEEQVTNFEKAPGGDTMEASAGGSNAPQDKDYTLDELLNLIS